MILLVDGKNGHYRSLNRTMKSDLNDFAYFAEVVRHGGFAAAGRALREPQVEAEPSHRALGRTAWAASD